MADTSGLSEIELVWLIAWNSAAGEWDRIGLDEAEARDFLLDLVRKLQGDPLDAAKHSRGRLQQRLMALRRGAFDQIQQEAPFSQHARRNMDALLRAWMEHGDSGFARAWERIFEPGWQATRELENPIQIIGDIGDCEQRALEVKGAADQETRVAAEWWYLYYTFGRGWKPGMHATTLPNKDGAHFSVHTIQILLDVQKQVYFRLPW